MEPEQPVCSVEAVSRPTSPPGGADAPQQQGTAPVYGCLESQHQPVSGVEAVSPPPGFPSPPSVSSDKKVGGIKRC